MNRNWIGNSQVFFFQHNNYITYQLDHKVSPNFLSYIVQIWIIYNVFKIIVETYNVRIGYCLHHWVLGKWIVQNEK